MATHPRMSRAGRLAVTMGTVAAAVVGIGAAGTGAGHADPPLTITAVQSRIDALNGKLDQAVEDYDHAKVDLAAARRAAARAQHQVVAAKRRLAVLHAQIGAVAAAAYRGSATTAGGFGSLVTASDPQQFVDQATTLDAIGRNQAALLQGLTVAEHDLTVSRQEAAQQLATAKALTAKLSDRRAFIERALHQQRALLARLQARQRARLEAQRRAEAARQSRLQSAALATYQGPASGSAGVAVRWAYRELGKPYVWGAAGSDSFDCSGLTMYVWGKAGVGLPHSAAAQYDSAPHVSRSALQPGDLVFYGSPIHHVGIYVGGGNMIEAPHTGAVVRMAGIDRPDYVGAARP